MKRFMIGCGLAVCASPAWAVLHLELTQGIEGAIPVAIVSKQSVQPSAQFDAVLSVVRHDLLLSGRFQLPKRAQQQLSGSPSQADAKQWQSMGIDHAALLSLVPDLLGQPKVGLNLYDLYLEAATDQPMPAAAQLMPIKRESVPLRSTNVRQVAHHISDVIFQQVTGQRGIFSTRMVYVLRRDKQFLLQMADADGTNPQTLLTSVQPIMSPAWAPDSKHIAYVSFEQHKARVYVQEIATGKREIVAEYNGINGAPAWSPDGQQLAIVTTLHDEVDLFALDMRSRKLTQLTHGHSIDTEPAWSPDGKQIVFTSNRGGPPQIYRLDLASHEIERMTFQGRYNARASYTPDGKYLVMIHRDEAGFAIAKQEIDTGQLTLLSNSGADESPNISANGQMVLYATHQRGRGVLGMVSIDGRIHLRLPAQAGDVEEPAWSPFLT